MANAYGGSNGAVTVGTSPVVVYTGRAQGKSVMLRNTSASATVYVGYDGSVTSADGMDLKAGEALRFELRGGAIWAVASAAGTVVKYLSEG